MQRHPDRLWLTAFALGFAFDFLFWEKEPGVSFALFVALCLAAGFWLLRQGGTRPARRSLWLLAPIAFLAVMTFVRREPMTSFLNYALTLALLALLTMTFSGGRWLEYSLGDFIGRFFRLAGSALGRGAAFAVETRRLREGQPRPGGRPVWAVLRGLLLALPILAVFAALLSSADLVFADRLDRFIELFRLENLPEYIFRGVYISVLAYLLVGVILHAAYASGDEKLTGEGKPLVGAFLGFTESAIVLGSLTLLFAAFVAVQFRYFFGGQANITAEGYTYAEYARRGFSELVTVAVLSLLLLLGLSGVTRREARGQRLAFSILTGVLVALVLVMLLSAFQRLLLYEAAYGFTRLRTYTHVFMIWLGLLLVTVIALEALRRQRAFALAALLALLGFAVSLNVVNVDALIVRQNVARLTSPVTDALPLDSGYLASLSTDSVPALARAFRDPQLAEPTRETLGALLVCRRESLRRDAIERPWQSFHLSTWRAERVLASLDSSLARYAYRQDERDEFVVTPGGLRISCYGYAVID